MLLQYIAKEEKISISEDELSKELMNYILNILVKKIKFWNILKNPSSVESIKGPIIEQKILDNVV